MASSWNFSNISYFFAVLCLTFANYAAWKEIEKFQPKCKYLYVKYDDSVGAHKRKWHDLCNVNSSRCTFTWYHGRSTWKLEYNVNISLMIVHCNRCYILPPLLKKNHIQFVYGMQLKWNMECCHSYWMILKVFWWHSQNFVLDGKTLWRWIFAFPW